MTSSTDPIARVDARVARRKRVHRILRRTLYTKLAIVLGLAVLLAGVYLRLVAGPVSLQSYSDKVADALASRLGPGWRVKLTDTAIELHGVNPALRTSGLEVRNPAGGLVLAAPSAVVSVDPKSLLVGSLSPRRIELRDLQLRVLVAPDGSLSLVPPGDTGPSAAPDGVAAAAATAPPQPTPPADGRSQVATAIASILGAVLDGDGLVGPLDRAVLTNARLTLIGSNGRERVGFDRVGAVFERLAGANRNLELTFDGPHGAWRIGGRISDEGGGRRSADLTASDVPLTDVMLLTGLSSVPAGTDLKLSGHVQTALDGRRLTQFGGSFESSAGTVTRPGQPPLQIDRMSGEASWDEDKRSVVVSGLDVKSRRAELHLSGLLQSGEGGWRLKLAGHDAVMESATAKEPAFRIADVAAELNFDEHGVSLDRLALKGERLDVSMSGASVPGGNGTGARAVIEAHDTDIRKLFALWPPEVNPDLRNYLVGNMVAGTLTSMRLKTDFDADELRNITNNKPVSEGSVGLAFTLADTKLNIFEGLPQLTRLNAEGKSTGTRISILAKGGRVEMPDGRTLNFSDGFYDQPNLDKRDSVAKISFRLDGGADAMASLLRSPALRQGGGGFDIDPANVKGRAEMRVGLPLAVHDIPKPAELPLAVSGTLSDLTLEKALGREKLENGNLAVAYDSGALSVRGDGKVGGSPATIDLRQPRGAPGDVTVNLSLDEAARTRRSLPSAPQLSGAIPVKIVAPFGPGAKGPMRFDADLSRASVDSLLPGWSKAAGRPGRLTFALGEGANAELRDIVLDSGSTQIRGTATLGQEGGIEKADLSSVKLSPGDDLRAQLERNGGAYRINLKGNVGDARPVLKWLTAPGGGGGGGGKGREQPDIDLDVGVNIVTGFNDEALTGVVASVSTRKGDLRSMALRGQFRSAPVDVQLSRRDGPQPVLTVQSGDAGATLRFVDLYRRMVGGSLRVSSLQGDGAQSGTVAIDNFVLRGEPALRRIAAQGPPASSTGDDRGGSAGSRLDGDQVQFTKLTGEFRRSASRTDFRDVVVWGAQVGFNLSGYLDTAKDRTEVNGTFVPAYGLNNAFSQLPILGFILGGDRNEGLFAVNFKVAGSPTAPTLTVNPISAVAPGILRKIFGLIMQDGETTTGTVPQIGPLPRPADR